MSEESHELDELDQIAEDLKEHSGGRNLRTEAASLRGKYLSRWMDLELNLDELITEYLEVPDAKRDDMSDGLLPGITSVNAKVEFLKIIVHRVDPSSEAYSLTQKAQRTRNALAHRAAHWADVSPEVQAGAIGVVDYKHGRRRVTYIQPSAALAELRAAAEAIFELTLKARPDYLDRMKARPCAVAEPLTRAHRQIRTLTTATTSEPGPRRGVRTFCTGSRRLRRKEARGPAMGTPRSGAGAPTRTPPHPALLLGSAPEPATRRSTRLEQSADLGDALQDHVVDGPELLQSRVLQRLIAGQLLAQERCVRRGVSTGHEGGAEVRVLVKATRPRAERHVVRIRGRIVLAEGPKRGINVDLRVARVVIEKRTKDRDGGRVRPHLAGVDHTITATVSALPNVTVPDPELQLHDGSVADSVPLSVIFEPPTRRFTVRTPPGRVKGAFGVADAMACGHP